MMIDMASQFGTDLDTKPNPTIKYSYTRYSSAYNCTYLMKLVLVRSRYTVPNDKIQNAAMSNINAQNSDECTALHLATISLSDDVAYETIKLLIDLNANTNIIDCCGRTPLHYITLRESSSINSDIIKLLIDAGTNVNIVDKFTNAALHNALIHEYDTHAIKLLLDAGANVNIRDWWGKTALFYSFYTPEILQLVIDAGAKINAQDKYGNTVLHTICENNSTDSKQQIIPILINAGVDINIKNSVDQSALFYTINDIDTIKILIDANADVNIRNKYNDAVLDIIARNAESDKVNDIIYLLVCAGANIMYTLHRTENIFLTNLFNARQNKIKRAVDTSIKTDK